MKKISEQKMLTAEFNGALIVSSYECTNIGKTCNFQYSAFNYRWNEIK